MQTIPLKEACELLENASAVIVPTESNRLLIYPGVNYQGDGDNAFLQLSWDYEGQDYRVDCFEGHNETVEAEGSSLFFADEDGETLELILLEPMKIV